MKTRPATSHKDATSGHAGTRGAAQRAMAVKSARSVRPAAKARVRDRLKLYRAKRHFDRTPEPADDAPAPAPKRATGPQYVIQKHDARRLHYDFRLELDGA